jgi:NAD(P)-dependent dehydrogenase (short-subunit alcohol dehydrogenase family)
MADAAKTHGLACVLAVPCFTGEPAELPGDRDGVMVGGAAAFPSGADATEIKAAAARHLLPLGVNAVNMAVNVGALKPGQYDRVQDDIRAAADGCGAPVKSILESGLPDDEIRIASGLAAKAGVAQLTKSLAAEQAKYGIRANCISPGYMQTDQTDAMPAMLPDLAGDDVQRQPPWAPSDLAGAYVYFASDASKYATGSDLIADGSYTLV